MEKKIMVKPIMANKVPPQEDSVTVRPVVHQVGTQMFQMNQVVACH